MSEAALIKEAQNAALMLGVARHYAAAAGDTEEALREPAEPVGSTLAARRYHLRQAQEAARTAADWLDAAIAADMEANL